MPSYLDISFFSSSNFNSATIMMMEWFWILKSPQKNIFPQNGPHLDLDSYKKKFGRVKT